MKAPKQRGGKTMSKSLNDDHSANLPTIRITEITLENFKSVKYGNIVFNCGKKFIPYGTQADILGLYGQNGSGKTSLIEALSILKHLMSGVPVPDEYADCIDVEAEYASLTFCFEFQYPDHGGYPTNNDIRKVVYSLKLSKVAKESIETPHVYVDDESVDEFVPVSAFRVKVFDEILKMSGTVCGQKTQLKPFCDTSKEKSYIEPSTKAKLLVGSLDEKKRVQLGVNKSLAETRAQSFVFMGEMMKLYRENSGYSVYYQTLVELRMWAKYYLFVVDSKSTGLIRLNFMLPVFVNNRIQVVPVGRRFDCSEEACEDMKDCFKSLSVVLTQIVPGLTVEIMDHGQTLLKEGEIGRVVELVAKRGDITIPLRCESDGVRKLISTLNLLIMVFNQQSTTVAYDEFDAGVYEYLLGEILAILQSSGKGQFIFTSHNLRPLEVVDKKFLCFTTTNPENRYIQLKGVGSCNNLRDVYFREIQVNEQEERIYNKTKRHKIVAALKKAGMKEREPNG